MTFEERLEEVNNSLARVSIRQRGKKLSIRGTFPPKPGDGDRDKSYEISTGKPATPAGLKQAKGIAEEIDGLLIREKFDWKPYLKDKQKPAEIVGEWVEKFEAHHWEHVPKNPTTLNSWHKDYELKFNHLPKEEPLTIELLRRVILDRTEPGSRSRDGYGMAFRRLAEFAELPEAADLKKFEGVYSRTKPVNPRNLPSDEKILEVSEQFKGGWKWLYIALAVFGLRPHEALLALPDRLQEDPPLLEIPDRTKTGYRIAFPIAADEWNFDVRAYELPPIQIEGRNNNQLGMAVSQKFRQLNVGFVPYDLRHSFARRGFEFGFFPDFLAQSMGHSIEIHVKTYRAWWGDQPFLRVYRDVMSRRARASAHQEE